MVEKIVFDDAFVSVPAAVRQLFIELPDFEEDGYLTGYTELGIVGRSGDYSRKAYFQFDAGTSMHEVIGWVSSEFEYVRSFECEYEPDSEYLQQCRRYSRFR